MLWLAVVADYQACQQFGFRLFGYAGLQHDELVASEARYDVVGPNHVFETPRHLFKQRVAGGMTISIIDRLEPVEVEIVKGHERSEEHTSELQSLMRISYAVFCLKKQRATKDNHTTVRKTRRIDPT